MATSNRSITLEVVKQLAIGEIVWDAKISGFGVRRQKSDARTYIVKARVKNKQRWFAIRPVAKVASCFPMRDFDC